MVFSEIFIILDIPPSWTLTGDTPSTSTAEDIPSSVVTTPVTPEKTASGKSF